MYLNLSYLPTIYQLFTKHLYMYVELIELVNIKMNTNLKLKSIHSYLDYHEECSVCGREIKHVYETNNGNMGRNCYYKELGFPIKSRKKNYWNEIAPEALELIAVDFVQQIENMNTNDLMKACIKGIEREEFENLDIKYIQYCSKFHFNYNAGKGHNLACFFGGFNGFAFTDLFELPSKLIAKLISTKYFGNYCSQQIGMYKFSNYGYDTVESFNSCYDGFKQYWDFENRKLTY